MYPKAFDYIRAESLDHALGALADHAPNIRVLAGGQSLVQQMKLQAVSPATVVDISALAGLDYVHESDGEITIGPLVRHADVLARDWPAGLELIADAASVVADVQVRNRGTLCGALAHADPVGDWGPVLQAAGASVRVRSVGGERVIPVAELFEDAFRTVLRPDELITEIAVPVPKPSATSAYMKLSKQFADASIVTVAVQLTLANDGTCTSAGIGIGGLAATPVKPTEAESFLQGKRIDQAMIDLWSELLANAATPREDTRATAEYRAAMLLVVFEQAIDAARKRSTGAIVSAGYL